MSKKYVIGDIHGTYRKLKSVLSQITIEDDDYIIFLGDYIDRGRENVRVLKTVYALQHTHPNVICLMGNHESMLIDALDGHDLSDCLDNYDICYALNGGENTMYELEKLYAEDRECCEILIAWIKQLPLHFELDGMHFSHSGFNPYRDKHDAEDYLWTRDEMINGYHGDAKWYIGHTPVQYLGAYRDEYVGMNVDKPVVLPNNITMMDTGSFMKDGKISCLEITSGKLYQSIRQGRKTNRNIEL